MRRLGNEPPGSTNFTAQDAAKYGQAAAGNAAYSGPASSGSAPPPPAASSDGDTNIFGLSISTPVLWGSIGVIALVPVIFILKARH